MAPISERKNEPLTSRQIAAVSGLLLLALSIRLFLAPIPSTDDDIYFQTWSHLLVERGIAGIYDFRENQYAFKPLLAGSGAANLFPAHEVFPDPYIFCDYPPLFLYILKAVGHIYKGLFSPAFDETTGLFRTLLKTPTILADVLIALIIFSLIKRRLSFRAGLIGLSLYAFSPAIIFSSSYAGFPEALSMLFILLSLEALERKLSGWAWASLAVSIWLKPQGAVFLPLVVFVTYRWGLKGMIKPAAAALLVTFLAFMPFLLLGRPDAPGIFFGQVMARSPVDMEAGWEGWLPREEVLSMGAFNLWWLWGKGRGYLSDGRSLLGPFTYRQLGLILFALSYALVLFNIHKKDGGGALFRAGWLISFFFFMLPTQIAERYLFCALPLLLLSGIEKKDERRLYLLLSATYFLNLYLIFYFIPLWPWRALGGLSSVSPTVALWASPFKERIISLCIALINLNILVRASLSLCGRFYLNHPRLAKRGLFFLNIAIVLGIIIPVEMKPREEAAVFWGRGRFYLNQGWAGLAIDEFEKAVKIDPTLSDARYLLAAAWAAVDEKEKAITILQDLLRRKPQHRGARMLLKRLKSPAAPVDRPLKTGRYE